MTRWLAVVLGVGLLAGCPGFGDKTLAELEGIEGVPTWHADIEPLVARRCGICHGDTLVGGAPFPLVTLDQVVSRADRVRVRAVQIGDMPPGAGLPDGEKALLEAWIAGGMPEGEPRLDADVPPPDMGPIVDMDPNSGPPTWDDEIGALLQTATCSMEFCHAGEGASAGLDLSSYQGFIAGSQSGAVHGDGDPAAALLVDRLRARNGNTVMPLGGPARPEAEILRIEAWIQAGFPEN